MATTYEIVKGISQAMTRAYDGAHDENGEPVKIGLKREEGNPLIDKRVMDGFGVKFHGNRLMITYHAEIMLKDIYTLGIAILELMIGRTSKTNFSISLDSLPLTWAEFPESTPLIQVLVQCIQIDSITERKGRLQGIKKLLTREYKKYF